MFENPLNKYAAGGVAASQEQRAEESFINAIAQQLQQEPEQVRARYEEIKSNPDEMQELQNAVQTMQKDKKKGVQMIVALFQKQAPQQGSVMSAEQGSKIQNFVSKHAKGGNIEKAQKGYKVKNKTYEAEVKAPGDTVRTKKYPYSTQTMTTYPNGNVRYDKDLGEESLHWWSSASRPNLLQRIWFGNKTVPADIASNWEDIIANHPEDPRNVPMQQSGGNVNMFGKITSYQNPVSTTPADSSAVEYNPLFRALLFKDINGNDVVWARRHDGSYTYRNGMDNMYFDPNQDAGYIPFGKLKAWNLGVSGSTKLSDKDTQDLKNLESYAKSNKKEDGGKVEKAQDGSILDYYSNKWSNDLARIKSGWNKFRESAPGKVWGAFMPNPNSETGMLGATAPVGKISSLGKAASKLDDEVKVLGYYDDLGNFIKTEGDDIVKNAGDYMNKPKWPEFEMPNYNSQPNFIEPDYSGIDFNNLVTSHADLGDWISGGIIAGGIGGAAYAGAKMAESETKNKKENKSNSKSTEKKQSGGLMDFYKNKWKNDFFD